MSERIPPEILTSLGYPQTVAVVFSTLVAEQPCELKNIASKSPLSASQVANGLRQCRELGWVESNDGEKIGRGRPPNVWSVARQPTEILSDIEVQIRQEKLVLEEALRNISLARGRA